MSPVTHPVQLVPLKSGELGPGLARAPCVLK